MERTFKNLTAKEEVVMNHFWQHGDLFVRELLEQYGDPKPHFNTLSTVVRGLEEKGYLSHRAYGSTHQYFAIISKEEFRTQSLKSVIGKYYGNSIFSAVSSLVENKELGAEELKELLDLVNGEE